MRITIIHPAIGHRRGERYIRSWQMEPLPAAVIAGLTPKDIDIRFYDDRMEAIPFDEPTEAALLSVETYTAQRAYQIASEYRKRGIPVIFGGFHATLMPEEAEQYAEAIVIGEAEPVWPEVIDDLRHARLKKRYQAEHQPDLADIRIDRSIFHNKRYLPIGLVETGRGCRFPCEFCAIQSFFQRSHRQRPIEHIIEEISRLRDTSRLFFFVDDNFAGNINTAKPLLRELARLKIRWITQMSINAAHDEEFLALMRHSGCTGVLIGFESLNPDNLSAMKKDFNLMKSGYQGALNNLRRHNIRVYGTFVFGYDHDSAESFDEAVEFALEQKFYIAAFNHLTPFPGTPLYRRLQQENRLHYPAWWLDQRYRYNDVPFSPARLKAEEITRFCVASRKRFYSLKNILRRGLSPINRSDLFMFRHFFPINLMHTVEINKRNGYPLGDEEWKGTLLTADVMA
jgi:radical SAM superfamily enzyme YgiQ (UPF0313 family)